MRLLKLRITAFKSIQATELVLDPKITVLVGANEGGKTNILKALECFNQDREFSDTLVCQTSREYTEGQFPEIQFLFGDFSSEERASIPSLWEQANKDSSRLIEETSPEGEPDGQLEGTELPRPDSELPGTEYVVINPPPLSPQELVPFILRSFTKLTVTRQGNRLEDFFFHFDDTDLDSLGEDIDISAFKDSILKLLPRMLYFDDINLLRGEISLDDLLGGELAYQTERNLLALGGIGDLQLLAGSPHRRDVAIKNAERRVTDRLRKYWTQDPTREFHLDVDRDILRVRISDATGVYDFPENRSLGSRWFISFYINFVSRVEGLTENAILLFDEPGIHIHPRGQRDLLPFLEELGTKHQISFSTHLPFLINRNFPSRIRVIQKEGKQGTTINNKPHQNRWKAIRSAVGLLAADSFLIGDTCLVVEGVSDHLYLAGISPILAELGIPHLNLNEVGIIPASSASETIAPARFCQAEKIPVVVLLDSDSQGDQARETLLRDNFIGEDQVVRINDALPGEPVHQRAIEDLLPINRFLDAVNGAYRGVRTGYSPINSEEVRAVRQEQGANPLPIVNALTMIFTQKQYGAFDKRLVSEFFVNNLPNLGSLSSSEKADVREELQPLSVLCNQIASKLRRLAGEAAQ